MAVSTFSQTSSGGRIDWPRRVVETLLAMALCAVAALWLTRFLAGEPIAAPPTVTSEANHQSGDARDRWLASAPLFGARRNTGFSDNIQALGIIVDADGSGSVVLSIDGQPARAFRVGDDAGGRRLSRIGAAEIEVEGSGTRQVVRLPQRPAGISGMTYQNNSDAVAAHPPGSPAVLQ